MSIKTKIVKSVLKKGNDLPYLEGVIYDNNLTTANITETNYTYNINTKQNYLICGFNIKDCIVKSGSRPKNYDNPFFI